MEKDKERQAEIIRKLIDSLAAELGRLKNQPARREELIQQIRSKPPLWGLEERRRFVIRESVGSL